MKEIGGYLELELRKGSEYYSGEGVLAVDTGRTAMYCALADCKAKKVYLPYYLCTSMLQVPQYLGISYEFYAIDEDFMPPEDLRVADDEAFLYINYFGTGSVRRIQEICRRYANVLVDNTQAFFSKPFEAADRKGGRIYHLYSARKFFGVSDGAYVIADGMAQRELIRDVSHPHAAHLLKRIEVGANAAYADNMRNENRFDDFYPKAMSLLSRRILQGIDYEEVKAQRRRNFEILQEEFSQVNELPLVHDFEPPMVYPLLVEVEGLGAHLVANKIYVPHWWKDVLRRVRPESFEARLSNRLIPLPIDQRYGEEEMRYMASIVKKYLRQAGR